MSEIKLPFTQTVGKIIAGVIVVLMLGGYFLYFGARSSLSDLRKDMETLKDKHAQTETELTTIKNKYDSVYNNVKQMTENLQDSLIKYRECEQKLLSLQAKYNAISQQPPSSTSAPSAPAAPTAPSTAPESPPPSSPTGTSPEGMTPPASPAETNSMAPSTSGTNPTAPTTSSSTATMSTP